MHFTPAAGEVLCDICHRRAAHFGGNVVPAEATAHGMVARVETVASEGRQVDAPDERNLSVHDHELLVMTVHGALARVQGALHARTADELLSFTSHPPPRRREDGQRCAGPEQDPDVHPPGELAEQVSQPQRVAVAREPEIGRDVPAGDVDVRARPCEGDRDLREGLLAVDKDP